MNERCEYGARGDFSNYGGRGIKVCVRWRESYEAFLADMGPRPPVRSLDRIDNNANYEPSNCRWATREEQARNTRATKLTLAAAAEIRALAGRLTQREIAERFNVSQRTVCSIQTGRTWREGSP
jgi:hypothetical protein